MTFRPGDRVLVTEPILGARREPARVEKVLPATRARPWARLNVRFEDESYSIVPGRAVQVAASDVERAEEDGDSYTAFHPDNPDLERNLREEAR